MPMELLKAIEKMPLPLTITDPHDIDKLRVLKAAGYVTVLLPSPVEEQTFATVLYITAEGRTAILDARRSDLRSSHSEL